MAKVFIGAVTAVESKGFWKAVIYSFISFFVGWLITWLAVPATATAFASFAWIIPVANTVLVFIKQYIDALKK